MNEIHCHHCGGFIGGDPRGISYRLLLKAGQVATPHTGLCACDPPIVYKAPPGYASSPGIPVAGPGNS